MILSFMIAVTGAVVAMTNWLNQRAAAQKMANAEASAKASAVASANTAHLVEQAAVNTKAHDARSDERAAKVKEQITDLQDATDEQSKVIDATHTLVNSSMGQVLKAGAISARLLAEKTGDPEHRALADVAQRALEEHDAKQSKVDNKA